MTSAPESRGDAIQNQSGQDQFGPEQSSGVAIVGMSGRFPGARNVSQFWDNIKAGEDTITRFDIADLELDIPEARDGSASYVCAKGILDDIDQFDGKFFGYLPREIDVMDPQHRMFLEICWEAMEHAGYDASRYPGAVGVYGGCYMDTYLLANLCSDEAFRRHLVESIQVGSLQTELGNDKDYFATRVAFKMGLRGPAMTLQTACSTSLVAISTACQALETYGCDMALAGGVTIVLPQRKGYFYKEGSMLSPDGSCRPFDAGAAGTVFSNGAAVLLLKRVEDAVQDGDTIYAVIRGYGNNNDGGDKLSYTAPSAAGQAEVIAMALDIADIDARTIGYVEAHGTATPLGDPIEIRGLTDAYRRHTDDTQYCALGSVKANLGHLDVASGAIGLIKTSMALHEKIIPPLKHFKAPNPNIDFAETPFYVPTEPTPWEEKPYPRRAGVSSFGVGGTNAHVVVEEAPPSKQPSAPAKSQQLVVLSAQSKAALAAQAAQLAEALRQHPATDLADMSYTLQVGRQAFAHRQSFVGADREQLITVLSAEPPDRTLPQATPEVVFLLPGQGAQYPGMARQLYDREPAFRATIDEVLSALDSEPLFEGDLRRLLLWTPDATLSRDEAAALLAQTRYAQPGIFALEMALSSLLRTWGVQPAALVGHSVGEIAAACLAGVFSLADASRLAVARGALMQAMPPGEMLAIRAPLDQVQVLLPEGIGVAGVNSPHVTVVSGPSAPLQDLAARLAAADIQATVLKTSHAFHSEMMAGAKDPLTEWVAGVDRAPAAVPIVSTVTGEEAAPDTLADPAYWGRQLLKPVLFADAVKAAAASPARILLEVGPGQTLHALARQSLTKEAARPSFACLGPVQSPGDDLAFLLGALGRLWEQRCTVDWAGFHGGLRRRIPLPTYPFERRRHWIDPTDAGAARAPAERVGRTAEAPCSAEPPVAAEQDRPLASPAEVLIRQQLDILRAQMNALGRKS